MRALSKEFTFALVTDSTNAMEQTRKKVVQVIPTLDRAGAEKQLVMLATSLPRDQFDVSVVVLTRTGPLEQELRRAGVPVIVVGKKWRFDPWALWRLYRTIRRLKPDLMQTWLFAANAYGRFVGLLCKVPHLVASERCVDPWKTSLHFAIDRRLAARSDAIVAVCEGVKRFYVRHGIPEEKIVVIRSAVESLPPPTKTRDDLLNELQLPQNAKLVALIGRFWPQKRIEDAIWACDLLKTIRDDVHLLIIGDGPLREHLYRYRQQVRIEDKVHFLGLRHDMPDILPHVDIVWSTSGYEGLSNAIMEAMVCGKPVVATNIPGTTELVIHNRTGLLFAVGDRAALAKATHNLLSNPEFARQLGSNAKKHVLHHFSKERMIGEYVTLYRHLLG